MGSAPHRRVCGGALGRWLLRSGAGRSSACAVWRLGRATQQRPWCTGAQPYGAQPYARCHGCGCKLGLRLCLVFVQTVDHAGGKLHIIQLSRRAGSDRQSKEAR